MIEKENKKYQQHLAEAEQVSMYFPENPENFNVFSKEDPH